MHLDLVCDSRRKFDLATERFSNRRRASPTTYTTRKVNTEAKICSKYDPLGGPLLNNSSILVQIY